MGLLGFHSHLMPDDAMQSRCHGDSAEDDQHAEVKYFACQAIKAHLARTEAGKKGAQQPTWGANLKAHCLAAPCQTLCDLCSARHSLSARVNWFSRTAGLAWGEEDSHGVASKLLEWAVAATTDTACQVSWT